MFIVIRFTEVRSKPSGVFRVGLRGGGSKSRKFKWLVKVGAKGCHSPD